MVAAYNLRIHHHLDPGADHLLSRQTPAFEECSVCNYISMIVVDYCDHFFQPFDRSLEFLQSSAALPRHIGRGADGDADQAKQRHCHRVRSTLAESSAGSRHEKPISHGSRQKGCKDARLQPGKQTDQ